ncbi:11815_t:CDS:2 [Ambispora gerdemannii]|uniref:D-arabinono-1,4-lactone oxidase n=1 Tax=Ambispora gerdemannii TaxID=144530 RepID=A0A9N9F7M5_9GLOM|nr:11815_t:CDS:2 [Ambispora gerdemannii]
MSDLFKKLESKIDKSIEKGKESLQKSKQFFHGSGGDFHHQQHHVSASNIFGNGGSTNEKAWQNWAGNIYIEPEKIFRPSSLKDLKEIIRKAKKHGKKIRCVSSGRNTWSSLSVTRDYLVIVDRLAKVEVQKSEKYGWIVTADAGATIKQIDDTLRVHNPPLALDSMTQLDSVGASGIVATGSYGVGLEARCVSDKVVSVQIVTADGELREFTEEKDSLEMSAARVNLGLLGIIYKVTWRVEPLFNLRLVDSQPLLKSSFHPAAIKELYSNADSLEIVYWPFNESEFDFTHDKLWVKQWTRHKDDENSSEIANKKLAGQRIRAEYETKFGENQLYKVLVNSPECTPYISNLIWKTGPASKPQDHVLHAPDAIHHQIGGDNVPYEDLEFAFKLGGKDEFGSAIEEFRFIISKIYEYAKQGRFPVNLTTELRFVKSSRSLLAPVYDEDPNAIYCYIQVLAVRKTLEWEEFSSELAARWINKYKARPHWSKHWEYVPGIKPHLHDTLSGQIQKFEKVRAKYDPEKLFFDNESLKEIFYGVPKADAASSVSASVS